MYELKTLLPQFEINVPKCMYEMKNISLSANAVESVPGASPTKKHLNVSFFKEIHTCMCRICAYSSQKI